MSKKAGMKERMARLRMMKKKGKRGNAKGGGMPTGGSYAKARAAEDAQNKMAQMKIGKLKGKAKSRAIAKEKAQDKKAEAAIKRLTKGK